WVLGYRNLCLGRFLSGITPGRMLNKTPLVPISSLKYCENAMITQKVSADPEAFFWFQRTPDRVFLTL
ncbi:hypothetical protein N8946_06825, partial [Pseudomonadales bacterium]|nr:hypothetical protein [Pseudomonadales bacterium]